MKTILFVMTNLNSGGIATSLVNLINKMADNKDYSVSLLLFDDSGSNIKQIPAKVSIILGNKFTSFLSNSLSYTKKASFMMFLFRIIITGLTRLLGKKIIYRYIFSTIKQSFKYDIAISFSQSSPHNRLYGGCNEFVIENVSAYQKITFLHADYQNYGLNSAYNSLLYSKFNKVACVSNSVKKQFLNFNPKLISQTFVVKNLHDCSKIRMKANESTVEYYNTFNILTVSRLSREKGLMRAMKVIVKLKETDIDFKWHIVGEGPLKQTLTDFVSKNNLSRNVILYGNELNPYRYMKNASILLVPSFHEAAPMVIEEAIILGLFVITTNTLSAEEMISSENIGVVCENSEEGMYTCLKKVMTEKLMTSVSSKFDECEIMNAMRFASFMKLISDSGGD